MKNDATALSPLCVIISDDPPPPYAFYVTRVNSISSQVTTSHLGKVFIARFHWDIELTYKTPFEVNVFLTNYPLVWVKSEVMSSNTSGSTFIPFIIILERRKHKIFRILL